VRQLFANIERRVAHKVSSFAPADHARNAVQGPPKAAPETKENLGDWRCALGLR
jgi:hypothetical protein